MSIAIGDTLPDATLLRMSDAGPEQLSLTDLTKGRSVVMVGLPGPFTDTCTDAHIPSLIRARAELDQEGVDEVICFAVIDPFVMKAWAETTGASEGGITMLADSAGELTKALGLDFDAPVVGFYGRTVRHSMLVEDRVVKILRFEESHGTCELTAGDAMVDAISELRAS